MTITDDLVSTLEDHAGVGAIDADRIYPQAFPAGTDFPCITYTRISSPTEQAVDRTIHAKKTWIQLDHWAESQAEVESSAAAAQTAILAMAGSTVDLHEVRLWSEMDGRDADSGLYRQIQEWWFVYS